MAGANVAHKISSRKRTQDVLMSENVDFAGLLLSEPVQRGLLAAGFEKPSPIQLKAIPLGRCGLDLIVQAKSGTGKTCVFSVIALENIEITSSALQVLVLAPTREIAVQIQDVIKNIGACLPRLACHTFIGGLPIKEDIQKLRRCQIAIGSPGRVKHLIEHGLMSTDSIRIFVLDEADKLLEDSFQEQINWIYSTLPDNKQLLALSATYPEYLAQHLTAYMRNPTFIRLNISDPALLGIKQYYSKVKHHPLPNKQLDIKTDSVISLLSNIIFKQCLIFSNLQTRAQNLCSDLQSKGWPTSCIAGSLDQRERLQAMDQLKTYKCRVLISTDLTSRGIDADKVDLVINLDVPYDHETYLHRIGRAGRYGSFGAAVSIVSEGKEEQELWAVERKCHTKIHPLPDPIPNNLVKIEVDIDLEEVISVEQIVTRNSLITENSGMKSDKVPEGISDKSEPADNKDNNQNNSETFQDNPGEITEVKSDELNDLAFNGDEDNKGSKVSEENVSEEKVSEENVSEEKVVCLNISSQIDLNKGDTNDCQSVNSNQTFQQDSAQNSKKTNASLDLFVSNSSQNQEENLTANGSDVSEIYPSKQKYVFHDENSSNIPANHQGNKISKNSRISSNVKTLKHEYSKINEDVLQDTENNLKLSSSDLKSERKVKHSNSADTKLTKADSLDSPVVDVKDFHSTSVSFSKSKKSQNDTSYVEEIVPDNSTCYKPMASSIYASNKAMMDEAGSVNASNKAMIDEAGSVNASNKPMMDEAGSVNASNKPMIDEAGSVNASNKAMIDEAGSVNASNKPMIDEAGSINASNKPMIDEAGSVNASNKPMIDEASSINASNKAMMDEASSVNASNKAMMDEAGSVNASNKAMMDEASSVNASNKPMIDEAGSVNASNKAMMDEAGAVKPSSNEPMIDEAGSVKPSSNEGPASVTKPCDTSPNTFAERHSKLKAKLDQIEQESVVKDSKSDILKCCSDLVKSIQSLNIGNISSQNKDLSTPVDVGSQVVEKTDQKTDPRNCASKFIENNSNNTIAALSSGVESNSGVVKTENPKDVSLSNTPSTKRTGRNYENILKSFNEFQSSSTEHKPCDYVSKIKQDLQNSAKNSFVDENLEVAMKNLDKIYSGAVNSKKTKTKSVSMQTEQVKSAVSLLSISTQTNIPRYNSSRLTNRMAVSSLAQFSGNHNQGNGFWNSVDALSPSQEVSEVFSATKFEKESKVPMCHARNSEDITNDNQNQNGLHGCDEAAKKVQYKNRKSTILKDEGRQIQYDLQNMEQKIKTGELKFGASFDLDDDLPQSKILVANQNGVACLSDVEQLSARSSSNSDMSSSENDNSESTSDSSSVSITRRKNKMEAVTRDTLSKRSISCRKAKGVRHNQNRDEGMYSQKITPEISRSRNKKTHGSHGSHNHLGRKSQKSHVTDEKLYGYDEILQAPAESVHDNTQGYKQYYKPDKRHSYSGQGLEARDAYSEWYDQNQTKSRKHREKFDMGHAYPYQYQQHYSQTNSRKNQSDFEAESAYSNWYHQWYECYMNYYTYSNPNPYNYMPPSHYPFSYPYGYGAYGSMPFQAAPPTTKSAEEALRDSHRFAKIQKEYIKQMSTGK